MAKLGNATVEVGDLLRRDLDGREGTVTAIANDVVTVTFPTLMFSLEADADSRPATEFHYNSWDPKFADSAKQTPAVQPTDMANANQAVAAAVHTEQEALIADAHAAVEAARVEAEETASRIQSEPSSEDTPSS